jgi:hypothetical protein
MFKNYPKIITFSVTFLSILSLIFFVLISLTRWKFADDYVFPITLQKTSVISFAFKNYMNWDAKFLMPFFLLWFTAVKYLSFKILMLLASFSFIGISYCLLIVITDSKKLIVGVKEKIILVATINIFTFIILYDSLSELLYWMSATCYVHSMLIGLIWLIYYNRKKKFSIFFYLFTFFVSSLPQNISLGLSMIVFIDLLVNDSKKQYLLLFIIFIFGVSASTFSPGSIIQLQSMQKLHYADSEQINSLSSYILHFFKIYTEALKVNYVFMFLFSFLLILLSRSLAGQILTKFIIRVNHLTNIKIDFKLFLTKYKYFFASFFCLSVYWPTLLYGYRYYYGFYIFIFLALIISINSQQIEIKMLNLKIYLLICPIIIISFLVYLNTLNESIIVANFIEKRNQILVKNKGKTKVDIPSLNINTFTRAVRFTDIDANPNYCTNLYYSEIYGIDTVISSYQLTREQILK